MSDVYIGTRKQINNRKLKLHGRPHAPGHDYRAAEWMNAQSDLCIMGMGRLTAEQKKDVEKRFLEVELLIYHTVHEFCNSHGTNFEDCLDRAIRIFFHAYYRWYTNANRSSFPTWIALCLNRGLRTPIRTRQAHLAALQRNLHRLDRTREFNIEAFCVDLSNEALQVVKLLLNTPNDVATVLKLETKQYNRIRQHLKQYLRGLDWSEACIERTFRELQDALA